jgi:FKBP-type peptidyl-prolyl cis-trans isomerase FklB
MKKIFIVLLIVSFFSAMNAQKVKNVKLKTKSDSISYAFGISIADNLDKQKVDQLNPLALGRAFQDFYNNETKINVDDANTFIQNYFMEQEAKNHEETINEGKRFLSENAKKDSVITLESGLQYKVITEGNGKSPTEESKVRVHYEGTLIDGTKFDSSYDRGEPAEFGVTQVIKGWTDILQLMKEGSVWMVYIPYDLAYGERQMGPDIKPFSTLVFKIELLKVLD